MIYFTSDLHVGHDKDFLWQPRGFTNIYDHDTAIIKNINEIIKYDDELWILGDLALGTDCSEWNRVFYNLNCQNIHFIIGNHDTNRKINKYIEEYDFILEGYANILKASKTKRFYLSHYPTICSNFDDNKHIFTVNLCGHSHCKNKFQDIDKGLIYHVELDAHNMYPVSIEQIIKDINQVRNSL